MDDTLFDDAALRDFLIHGFCLRALDDLPADFHRAIYDKTTAVIARDGNPGNNVLPQIPEVQQVFDHPTVRGVLSSLLGPTYVMHSHRHPHVTGPFSQGGGWHKDSYWGYGRIRDHHPRWIMAMYYPQDVPVEIGPTGAIPGSQYYESRVPRLSTGDDSLVDSDNLGIPAVGTAGMVLFIHFDLWHRAYPNLTDRTRYMFKFQFTRLDEPTQPYGNALAEDIPLGDWEGHERAPVWRQMWRWLRGDSRWTTDGDPSTLAAVLRDPREEARLSAAYTLGGLGAAGISALVDALRTGEEPIQRAAGYGLSVAGDDAIQPLVDTLTSESDFARAMAVYALGDRGARAAGALDALIGRATDPSPRVTRPLADALGQVRSDAAASVPALIHLLRHDDEQTRFNAAYGLAKFRDAAAPAVDALAAGLRDDNRYVRGHCAIALEQVGTAESLKALLHYLQAARWCPLTSKESTF